MAAILNYGSLNIDLVYRVPHIVRPGETISSESLSTFAGGKGANQSVALARAGATVAHAGKIGHDGQWLLQKLQQDGVDTHGITVTGGPTGQAVIQVNDEGQNAIVLTPGANHRLTKMEIDNVLKAAAPGSVVLLQNETNHVAHLIRTAHELGLQVCFNPAPFTAEVLNYPLELVGQVFVNEIEGAGLGGLNSTTEPEAILTAIGAKLPAADVVLTLGDRGAMHQAGKNGARTVVQAVKVQVVDTTAAGDTFIGYFLAASHRGRPVRECLEIACKAAAICVTRAGAMDSIPRWSEITA